MRNIKLTIAYDGTNFLGWQTTTVGASIQSTLKHALEQILQHEVYLQAASRTDAGVHATDQVVNFHTSLVTLNLSRLKVSLNGLLPKSIVINTIEEAKEDFHPTLNCTGKEYHYFLCYGTAQQPYYRHYSWHYPKKLDIDKMREAARALRGTHDFSSFCNVRKNHVYESYVRTIERIDIVELESERLRIEIQGNNFLYKMVRNLVGTLAYVGNGKINDSTIADILAQRNRCAAGITAPAHGLFLKKVFY